MYNLNSSKDLQPLIDNIGDASVVMLGEASHGTHEFYTQRTAISKKLIEEKGFRFIAVEGDWPDCYEINRYIKGYKSYDAFIFIDETKALHPLHIKPLSEKVPETYPFGV